MFSTLVLISLIALMLALVVTACVDSMASARTRAVNEAVAKALHTANVDQWSADWQQGYNFYMCFGYDPCALDVRKASTDGWVAGFDAARIHAESDRY